MITATTETPSLLTAGVIDGLVAVAVPGTVAELFMRPDDVVYYYEVLLAAAKLNKLDGRSGLIPNLQYLAHYACWNATGDQPGNFHLTQCWLTKDFAPLSFGFVLYRWEDMHHRYNTMFNGGLIFHGQHDAGGVAGSAPTFSVTLSPTDGWQVHT